MSQFADGTVVRLKSGGPPMTVLKTRSDGMVEVRWFVDQKLEQNVFPAESLTTESPSDYMPFQQG